uniref:Secreted protein n=1 Tax=Mesocestoides corti TaxID=53468 RepID=A0A5K3F0G9_MESCO
MNADFFCFTIRAKGLAVWVATAKPQLVLHFWKVSSFTSKRRCEFTAANQRGGEGEGRGEGPAGICIIRCVHIHRKPVARFGGGEGRGQDAEPRVDINQAARVHLACFPLTRCAQGEAEVRFILLFSLAHISLAGENLRTTRHTLTRAVCGACVTNPNPISVRASTRGTCSMRKFGLEE